MKLLAAIGRRRQNRVRMETLQQVLAPLHDHRTKFQELFGGREVDLVMEHVLKPAMRSRVWQVVTEKLPELERLT